MNLRSLLPSAILLLASATAIGGEPYNRSRIFWDIATEVTIFPSGTYARIIELQDGRLMCAAESGGVRISFSSDKGVTWSKPQVAIKQVAGYNQAVPDLIQLSDGTIIVGSNPRPNAPYSTDRKFGIRVARSTDNGETWSEPIFVFDASHSFEDGCWEPAFLELPSGDVQLYFANEAEYTSSGEQCISMCTSKDKGLTWSSPQKISFRAGSRDGMPVPVLLKDQSEIVVIIEDNGWPGRGDFTATTVRTSLSYNWRDGFVNATSNRRDMIFETTPAVGIISAAPYMCVLPWGETVASYQGNEGRNSGDLQYFDMFVEVGDEQARNFKGRTTPFSLPSGMHANWNSVSVIDGEVVCAVASIGQAGSGNSVHMMKGYPIKEGKIPYSSATIDAKVTEGETWGKPNGEQIVLGHKYKKRSAFDFSYDEDNLYFIGKVADTDYSETGSYIDCVKLYVDPSEIYSTSMGVGLYYLAFNIDGTNAVRASLRRGWGSNDTAKASAVDYTITKADDGYYFEASIPWSTFDLEAAPMDKALAINIEVIDAPSQYPSATTTKTETITDASNLYSANWLGMRLEEKENSSISSITQGKKGVTFNRTSSSISFSADQTIAKVKIYNLQGALVNTVETNATEVTTDTTLSHGIALVSFSNAEPVTIKF